MQNQEQLVDLGSWLAGWFGRSEAGVHSRCDVSWLIHNLCAAPLSLTTNTLSMHTPPPNRLTL